MAYKVISDGAYSTIDEIDEGDYSPDGLVYFKTFTEAKSALLANLRDMRDQYVYAIRWANKLKKSEIKNAEGWE